MAMIQTILKRKNLQTEGPVKFYYNKKASLLKQIDPPMNTKQIYDDLCIEQLTLSIKNMSLLSLPSKLILYSLPDQYRQT